MTADPYTPDEAELIGCYAGSMEEQAGENYDQAKADAERGIAKIKADALREAAAELEDREHCYNDAMSAAFVPGETGRGNVIQSYEAILEEPYGWLRERADRIEEEA